MGNNIIHPNFPVQTDNVQKIVEFDKGLLIIDTNKTLPFGLSIKIGKDMYISIAGRENHCYVAGISKDDETISSKKCKTLYEAFIFAIQSYSNRSPD